MRDVNGMVPIVVGHLGWIVVPRGRNFDKASQTALHLARVSQAEVEDQKAQARELPLLLFDGQHIEVPAVDQAPSKTRLLQVLFQRLHQLLRVVRALAEGAARRVLRACGEGRLPDLDRGQLLGAEALQHRPVRLPQLVEGLRVDGRGLHGDGAERGELVDDLLQQLRLVAKVAEVRVVAVDVLVALLIFLRGAGGCHVGHRIEDLGSHALHAIEQVLQGPQHDAGDGAREEHGEAHHQHDDHDYENHVAERVNAVLRTEVKDSPQDSRVSPDLQLVLLPPGAPPLQPLGGHVPAHVPLDLDGIVVLVAVKVLEVRQPPLHDVSPISTQGKVQGIHPSLHGEIVLRVGGHLEEGQHHHHDDDQTGHARGEGGHQGVGHGLRRVALRGVVLVLHARQEAQELHQLREAAGPGAEPRRARGAHDHRVVQVLGQALGDHGEVQRHGQQAHDVHPEEERVDVRLWSAYGLQEELYRKEEQDYDQDDVQALVAADVADDPEVREEEHGEEGREHHHLEVPVAVQPPAGQLELPEPLGERPPPIGPLGVLLLHHARGLLQLSSLPAGKDRH
mmetsp:Transcript_62892/g.183934  ORF Transcript_62892/g.183934 Transcript_62892/m.183934 type:complete len:565 (-) Transcript_62892:1134-2828(-)